ncbi:hypothetical protein NVIE_019620 [Nitrososphaera viennensis EN76]|uniref:Uncharacterized protein n=1 Tax=Nitrososphaera viennensis EN76 TaxID=926571 RepID=A0A060HL40_9ARCH|nr:hypothetical protein NVIE_019620 [Nitrososphaera viennensis EN76]
MLCFFFDADRFDTVKLKRGDGSFYSSKGGWMIMMI